MTHKKRVIIAGAVLASLTLGGTAYALSVHDNFHQKLGDQGNLLILSGYGDGKRQHGKSGMRMYRMLDQYDTNGDNALTPDEVRTGRAATFQEFDANADGNLTLDEYEALWLAAMRDRMVDGFQRLDNDGDGIVTNANFTDRLVRLVERMDRNGDGKLDREDRRRKGDH